MSVVTAGKSCKSLMSSVNLNRPSSLSVFLMRSPSDSAWTPYAIDFPFVPLPADHRDAPKSGT
jgi:hypothetical protein